MRGLIVSGLLLAFSLPAHADEPLPLFDAHVHYSSYAWDEVSVEDAFRAFDAMGVDRALVSSTPDEGTQKLKAHAPARVVPFLRPYRMRSDMQTWFKDPDVLDYVKGKLANGTYAGIGEFHLYNADDANAPEIKAILRIAVERDLYVHSHSGADAIRNLFKHEPDLKVVWAHAGMSEPASVVHQMMDTHKNLWADLSFREWDVNGKDGINDEWRALFLKHADRFMMGSDTYIAERWFDYEHIVNDHRKYLGHLPKDVATAIAHGNAQRLFGK